MRTTILSLAAVLMIGQATAQSKPAPEGAGLLFKNSKTKLTTAEQNAIYQQLDIRLTKDKRAFVLKEQKTDDEPFGATVYILDLNKDGIEEVMIDYGNTSVSGMAGGSVALFVKHAGAYKMNLNEDGSLEALTTVNKGYPDLLLGGPGFEFPVYRWNGATYAYYKDMGDAAVRKAKTTSLTELSKKP